MRRSAIAVVIVSAWACAGAARNAAACATTCGSSETDIFCKCSHSKVKQHYETAAGSREHLNELILDIQFETFYGMDTRVRYWNVSGSIDRYTECKGTNSKTHSFRIWGLEPDDDYQWEPVSCSAFKPTSGIHVTTSSTGTGQKFKTASLPNVALISPPPNSLVVASSSPYCTGFPYSFCMARQLANGDAFTHLLVEVDGNWVVVERSDGDVVWYVPYGPATWNEESQSFVIETSYGAWVQEMKPNGIVPFEESMTNDCIQHEITMYDGNYYFLSASEHAGDTWINRVVKADRSTGSESVVVDLHSFYGELNPRASHRNVGCQFANKCGEGARCVDWDHSNSIDFYRGSYSSGGYSYEGAILVSSRKQDQVSLFSADGSTLLWKLGLEGDFDLRDSSGTLLALGTTTNGDPAELEWFHDQHFARFIDDDLGELKVLIYDNNAEDDCGGASCTNPYDEGDEVGSRVFVLRLFPGVGTARIVRRLDIKSGGTWHRCSPGGAATPLNNDHFLVSCALGGASKIFEFDANDNVVWTMDVPAGTYRATPLSFPEP